MKSLYIIILLQLSLFALEPEPWARALANLSDEERRVIVDKGTQRPFVGKYLHYDSEGIYHCKVCNTALYRSSDKFNSHCGWPSFDDAIDGAIKRQKDADGRRIEILCSRCNAHLGHLFEGEKLTPKNSRYCVNSISLKFEKKSLLEDRALAYFAGGCFWGVEYYMEKLDGVYSVESGYMGGSIANPTYSQVSKGDTGHIESVEVRYNPSKISYEALARVFFEIHDPTQKDGQGPDIGEQYLSTVFVNSKKERETIERLISILEKRGYHIATKILDKKRFYRAKEHHQNYYEQRRKEPYCHGYIKRF